MLAHLRIADVVTSVVARLASDLAGYSLVGQVSHLLDNVTEFRDYRIGHSFQTSLAWSQRLLLFSSSCEPSPEGVSGCNSLGGFPPEPYRGVYVPG
jgi:hypothetical protein